jgi:hypothetical protein
LKFKFLNPNNSKDNPNIFLYDAEIDIPSESKAKIESVSKGIVPTYTNYI